MATTTFTGPIVGLRGVIAGPNPNASGTDQGGTTPFTYSSNTEIVSGSTTLDATTNEGVMAYVQDGANGSAVVAFSDGTTWLRCDTLANVSSS